MEIIFTECIVRLDRIPLFSKEGLGEIWKDS